MNEPTITATGNLTSEVDLRFTPTGRAVATIQIACNPRHQDATGAWVDDVPVYWSCQAWGTLAEHAADSLLKGDRVVVIGRVRANTWTPTEGPNAGVEQKRLEVLVDELGVSLRFTPTKPIRTSRGGNGTRATTSTPTPATASSPSQPPF